MNWKRVLKRESRLLLSVLKKFYEDHGFFLSAGITFNLLIGLIPLGLALLALAGSHLYNDQAVLSHISKHVEDMLPSHLDPEVMNNILTLIHGRKIAGVLGIGGLLWTSTMVFSSLRTALNNVFQVERGQGILKGKVIDLLMIFLAGIFTYCQHGNYFRRHLSPWLSLSTLSQYGADHSLRSEIPCSVSLHLLDVFSDLQTDSQPEGPFLNGL
jgi:uncharacterized BrkB/YihY/UPF0761 family membrane protein